MYSRLQKYCNKFSTSSPLYKGLLIVLSKECWNLVELKWRICCNTFAVYCMSFCDTKRNTCTCTHTSVYVHVHMYMCTCTCTLVHVHVQCTCTCTGRCNLSLYYYSLYMYMCCRWSSLCQYLFKEFNVVVDVCGVHVLCYVSLLLELVLTVVGGGDLLTV